LNRFIRGKSRYARAEAFSIMAFMITLTREPLQTLKVDAIGYGAKDTGEMGGGAAAAVLAAAGPEILTELRSKLAGTSRQVGDIAVTDAFRLQALGIRWVVHIISIIKDTPAGAYCPQPERLRDGVLAALNAAAELGARSVALSALGTGEGRVDPHDAARHMLGGVQAYRQSPDAPPLAITLSLPSYRDFQAFCSVLQSRGG
jgi:O-acetyl-ADP-ribose deacetylase (regulator of RNase III)